METEEKRFVDIEKCARCGLNHSMVAFKKFKIPISDSDGTTWEWWGLCYKTKEPILLKTI